MNQEELKEVQMTRAVPDVLSINDLSNKTPRTLLFGYNTDRTTVHVYICPAWGEIKTVVYGGYSSAELYEEEILDDADYIPTKRLYPECCDYEFCKKLAERGVNMTFTNWSEREEDLFYGKRI